VKYSSDEDEENDFDEPSAKTYMDPIEEDEDLVYDKGTMIAFQDHND
jgi:hypothetical protein